MNEVDLTIMIMKGLLTELPKENQALAVEVQQEIEAVYDKYLGDFFSESSDEDKAAIVAGLTIAVMGVNSRLEKLK